MGAVRGDLAATLGGLAEAIDADDGARLFMDRGDGQLELVADATAAGGRRESIAAGLRRVLATFRRPRLEADAAVALVAVPDVRGGLLVLERRRDERFSAEDLAVARLYARQLADQVVAGPGPRPIAWTSQLDAVQSVAAELTRLASVEEVAAALCTQTRRVIAYDNARVYVVGSDDLTLEPVAFRPQVSQYAGETADGLRLRVGEGITGWVAATGEAIIVPDSARDPHALDVPGGNEVTEESMLLAPLRSDGRVSGVVVLSRIGLHRFDEDDLRLLRVLADQAAVAIDNARLLATRDRMVAEMAALLEISRAGSEATSEAELADLLAGHMRRSSGADACLISRLDESTTELVRLGADGLPRAPERWDYLSLPTVREVILGKGGSFHHRARADLDPPEDRRLAALGGSSEILLPLTVSGRVIGLVELIFRAGPRSVERGEADLLCAMANHVAAALENSHLVERLRRAAEIDLISGVYSHRHLQDRLPEETARAARNHSPLAVLMVDLDDFKRINDEHGHESGDRVLRAVAACLRAAVRANDVVARYGGDEFVVLMPDTDERAARVVIDRIVESVAGTAHTMSDGTTRRVTCSVGLAVRPRDGRTGTALLRAADAAMYEHKRVRRSQPDAAAGTRLRSSR